MVQCPYCQQNVTPTKNAAGRMLCPLCGNTGKPLAAQPEWAPAVPPPAHATSAGSGSQLETPGKATAALILGIVSFVLPFVGLVTAILAWAFGNQAIKQIDAEPGRYTGRGMAKAGKILGMVWFFLIVVVGGLVVLAAVVFVLVSNLAGGNNTTSDAVVAAMLG